MSPLPLIQARLLRAQRLAAAQIADGQVIT